MTGSFLALSLSLCEPWPVRSCLLPLHSVRKSTSFCRRNSEKNTQKKGRADTPVGRSEDTKGCERHSRGAKFGMPDCDSVHAGGVHRIKMAKRTEAACFHGEKVFSEPNVTRLCQGSRLASQKKSWQKVLAQPKPRASSDNHIQRQATFRQGIRRSIAEGRLLSETPRHLPS